MAQELEVQRLVARLVGDISQYLSALNQAVSAVSDASKKIETIVTSSQSRVNRAISSSAADSANSIKDFGNQSVYIFDSVSESISSVTNKLSSMAGQATLVGGALSAMFGFATRRAVLLAANNESVNVSFETMLGSAKEARDVLARLTRFAATTPFQMPEILQAAKGLIQFGERGDELMDTLRILGNAAAATQTEFGLLALIFNQIRGVGKLLTQDFRQLATRGILSMQDLAKHFGVTVSEASKMLSEGKVTFEDVRQIFVNLSEEGGRFANQMVKQSTTFQGLTSTLSDNLNIVRTNVGKILAEGLKPLLKTLVDITSKLTEMGDTFNRVLAISLGSFAGISIAMTAIGGAVFGSMQLIKGLVFVVQSLGAAFALVVSSAGAVVLGIAAIGMAIAGLTILAKRFISDWTGLTDATIENVSLHDQLLERYKKQNEEVLRTAKTMDAMQRRLFLAGEIGKAERQLRGLEFRLEMTRKRVEEAAPTWRGFWLIGRTEFNARREELRQIEERVKQTKEFISAMNAELAKARKDTEPTEEALGQFNQELSSMREIIKNIGKTEIELKLERFKDMNIPLRSLDEFKSTFDELTRARNIEQVNERLKKMSEEIDRIGKSKYELIRLDLLALNATDQQLKKLAELQAREQEMQRRADVAKHIENLRQKLEELGLSEEELAVKRLKPTPGEEAEIRNLNSLIAARKEELGLRDEAKRIIDDNVSTVERLRKRYADLIKMQRLGLFKDAPGVFRNEVMKVKKELDDIQNKSRIDISFNFEELEFGTAQYFKSLQEQIRQLRSVKPLSRETMKELEEAKKLKEQIEVDMSGRKFANEDKKSIGLLEKIAQNTDPNRGIKLIPANI